jgi:hypothetical protein
MSELKPKRDDHLAADTPTKAPQLSKDTKPHGDKLQVALDAISEALEETKVPRNKKPH